MFTTPIRLSAKPDLSQSGDASQLAARQEALVQDATNLRILRVISDQISAEATSYPEELRDYEAELKGLSLPRLCWRLAERAIFTFEKPEPPSGRVHFDDILSALNLSREELESRLESMFQANILTKEKEAIAVSSSAGLICGMMSSERYALTKIGEAALKSGT